MSTAAIADLPSQYDHMAAQKKWYPYWESQGYFHAEANSKKPPYTIVIPPPNVTGALHLGHALNNTLQDILIRMRRMQGYNTLWMPGTDHAGIATQARVEKRLREQENLTRHDLGREGLVDRIMQWKDQYEERILGQLKQMGCSCDWERTRFTLDDQCARAVRETFFKLFADNKIYRGKRLVNWDTFLQTAVSDDEVFHEEVKGHFWHFRYPVVDPQPGEPTHVTIATTRPETMLGDTAVAVHPDPAKQLSKVEAELKEKLAEAADKDRPAIEAQLEAIAERRTTHLPQLEQLRDMAARGVMLELPLTGRQIPLITDIWAKPELGSGCVKITPAHDANDYEVWQRNQVIAVINIMETDGKLNDSVPEKYCGLTMAKARKAVVADLEELDLHDPETDVEDRQIELAHSDRSKTAIEPFLADQWFVKMDELAQSAMDAVTNNQVTITPARYAKSYLDWLSEKRDWPIGRQLWWGHRIPIWTQRFESAQERSKIDDAVRAINTQAEEKSKAPHSEPVTFAQVQTDTKADSGVVYLGIRDGNPEVETIATSLGFTQEEDVLDTWFSSALWPHSTLGWPEETEELKTFYPTSTLITSRDIITLWVARMVLTGVYNMGEVPFSDVFIHPKILDGFGETMSKSKGNGVDPLDVIDKFGADALRFGLAYLTTETQDVRMPVEFECPHCEANIKQTKKNRVLPRIECDKCKKPFSTQWAETEEDLALPRGAVVSERFELGRRFCNKLWNASRFCLMNLEGYEPGTVADKDLTVEDRWLLSRLATVTTEVTNSLNAFRYADAARSLYSFAWDDFCDYYVEMTKARFADAEQRPLAQRVLAHALDQLLRLLHPMIPFLTEEVWQLLATVAGERGISGTTAACESVCIADWPEAEGMHQDPAIEEQFAKFQAVLGSLREVRKAQNISYKDPIEFSIRCDDATARLLAPMQPYFTQMAKATGVVFGPKVEPFEISANRPLGDIDVFVDIADFIDVKAEKKRLISEQEKLAKFVKAIEGKLGNKNFVDRAPAEVVEQERAKLQEAQSQITTIEASLAKLV